MRLVRTYFWTIASPFRGFPCDYNSLPSELHRAKAAEDKKTAALHDLAELACAADVAKRRGVRLSSAAFEETWIADS